MLFVVASDLGNRDRLLRTVLDAGQAINALGHVRGIGFSAIQLEHRLRTDVHAGASPSHFFCIDRYHVHDYTFLLSVVVQHDSTSHAFAGRKHQTTMPGHGTRRADAMRPSPDARWCQKPWS